VVRIGLYIKGAWDNFRTRSALEAFENGTPLNIVGELGTFTIDPKKLFGRNLHNVDQIDSGRLKGYGRGITEQNGGETAARKAFESLTGRSPAGDYDRVVVDGFEVVFRATSRTKSGVPTVEVIHHADQFLEKIKFLP
jgi:hypothetical protein